MRAVKALFIVCLLCLGTTAFADIFPLNPPPDLFIDNINISLSGLTGSVETITDINGCESACPAGLTMFTGLDNSFLIYGIDPTDIYLQGTLVDGQIGLGGEAGFLIQVLLDDNAKWSALKSSFLGYDVTASSFGKLVAFNIHNLFFEPGDDSSGSCNDDHGRDDDVCNVNGGSDDFPHSRAFGDLAPVKATPEPASLTLVLGGAAAGLLRKKLAGKK
jgi:hypothetical protein